MSGRTPMIAGIFISKHLFDFNLDVFELIAADEGLFKVVKLLLANGASVIPENNAGENTLDKGRFIKKTSN